MFCLGSLTVHQANYFSKDIMLGLLNGQPQVTVEGTSVLGTVLALFYNSPGCHLDNPCLCELNRLFF